MKSSTRNVRRHRLAAALAAVFLLFARPAAATLFYGYQDPELVLDTRTDLIWLPIDATREDVERLAAFGTRLRFPASDTWRRLWAANFDVPVPIGRVIVLDGPINRDLVEFMEFLGGGSSDNCYWTAECYQASGWIAGGDPDTYEVMSIEYWPVGNQFALGATSTAGSYPFPNPCTGGLPATCSDGRFLVMSPVPLPAGLWLLGGALAALAPRRRAQQQRLRSYFARNRCSQKRRHSFPECATP